MPVLSPLPMSIERNTAIRYLGQKPVWRPQRVLIAAKDHLTSFYQLNGNANDSYGSYNGTGVNTAGRYNTDNTVGGFCSFTDGVLFYDVLTCPYIFVGS